MCAIKNQQTHLGNCRLAKKGLISFTHLIQSDSFLHLRLEMVDIFGGFGGMFGFSSLNPFPPHPEGTWFHFPSHDGDHFLFVKVKLPLDGVKSRTVFPSHLDDSVNILIGQF